MHQKKLLVALSDPNNFKALEAVDFIARKNGNKVKYYVASNFGLQKVLKLYTSLKTEVSKVLERTADDVLDKVPEKQEFEDVIKTAPVTKMVAVILRHAVEGQASDVHIEPGRDQGQVRYRVDGKMFTSIYLPTYVHNSVISRIKVMANLKTDETRLPQDGRFRQTIDEAEIDFRVSIMPLVNNREKAALRILDTSQEMFTLDQLGFQGRGFDIINDSIKHPGGITLVSGPTGSGKTTTLYTALNILNKEDVNIVTLEDPVEYFLAGVNQSQVRPEIGVTFARGLRSILRQDPNVIMVGEIRDKETADLAIHAGLTGHVVLSTLHTNDAAGAIPRLVDMGVEPFLIASALNLVVAQRLARRICPECKQEIKLPDNLIAKVKSELERLPDPKLKQKVLGQPFKFYKGEGCPRCNQTGYKGRIAIYEVLQITDELKQIIADGAQPEKVEAEVKKQQMISLRQDGLLKALAGVTTLEEIMTVTIS